MQTDVDLDAAMQAGLIGEDQAIALRNFQATQEGQSSASSEKFRLFGGYADLVTSIGAALALGAVALFALGEQQPHWLFIMAPVCFFLGRLINMRERPASAMALLIAYLGNALMFQPSLYEYFNVWNAPVFMVFAILLSSSAIATWIYWRAYRFPPTFAVSILLTSLFLMLTLAYYFVPDQLTFQFSSLPIDLPSLLALAIAIGLLVSAIWWDMTDIRRETERSQVAFWLHCCAGIFISRSLFSLLTGTKIAEGGLILTGLKFEQFPYVLSMIAVAAIISLLLERRSLLIAILLPAIGIFESVDGGYLGWALGMILTGACLLLFSWAWMRMRIALLGILPQKFAAQLPRTTLELQGQRPTRRHLPLLPRKFSKRVGNR